MEKNAKKNGHKQVPLANRAPSPEQTQSNATPNPTATIPRPEVSDASNLPAEVSQADLQAAGFDVRNNFAGGIEPRLCKVEIIHRAQMFRDVVTDDKFSSFQGIIVHYQRFNSWWEGDFESGGGNDQPDCASSDAIRPDQGDKLQAVTCAECPKNKFTGEGGKECKNSIRVHILRQGEILPIRLIVPATSIKPFEEYISGLTTKGIPFQIAVTEFSIDKATSAGNIEYGKLHLRLVETVKLRAQFEAIKGTIQMNRKQFLLTTVTSDERVSATSSGQKESEGPETGQSLPAGSVPY